MCNTEHTEKQKKSLYFHTGQIVFLNFTYFPVQKKVLLYLVKTFLLIVMKAVFCYTYFK